MLLHIFCHFYMSSFVLYTHFIDIEAVICYLLLHYILYVTDQAPPRSLYTAGRTSFTIHAKHGPHQQSPLTVAGVPLASTKTSTPVFHWPLTHNTQTISRAMAPQTSSISESFELSESSSPTDFLPLLSPAMGAPVYYPPYTRHTKVTHYPYGVVTGGALIDMAEHLSRTLSTPDWALSLWLQTHYIDPFIRINRLDGIIVPSEAHMIMLCWAHQNYCVVDPMPEDWLPPQILWVPGLEPMDVLGKSEIELEEPVWERRRGQEVFEASDMYGRKREREGKCLGVFTDALGWLRELWELPEKEEVDGKKARKKVSKKKEAVAREEGNEVEEQRQGVQADRLAHKLHELNRRGEEGFGVKKVRDSRETAAWVEDLDMEQLDEPGFDLRGEVHESVETSREEQEDIDMDD
jgi:hypothetical protein